MFGPCSVTIANIILKAKCLWFLRSVHFSPTLCALTRLYLTDLRTRVGDLKHAITMLYVNNRGIKRTT